jgi:hypothetical protein
MTPALPAVLQSFPVFHVEEHNLALCVALVDTQSTRIDSPLEPLAPEVEHGEGLRWAPQVEVVLVRGLLVHDGAVVGALVLLLLFPLPVDQQRLHWNVEVNLEAKRFSTS